MRSVWFLILFGSILTYHCFTTVSGEEIQSQQPSYSQCKPYVDAALKGEAPLPATSDRVSAEKPEDDDDSNEDNSKENAAATENDDNDDDSKEAGEAGVETDDDSTEDSNKGEEAAPVDDNDTNEDDSKEESAGTVGENDNTNEDSKEEDAKQGGDNDDDSKEDNAASEPDDDSKEQIQQEGKADDTPSEESDGDSGEDSKEEKEHDGDSNNVANQADQPDSDESQESQEAQESQVNAKTTKSTESSVPVASTDNDSKEEDDSKESTEKKDDDDSKESDENKDDSKDDDSKEEKDDDSDEDDSEEDSYIPRSREHLDRILELESGPTQAISALIDKATQTTLKELKTIYETAIKPLETMYKYRDLSNRHFGDPEIFSKPLVVLMGPWSGGKSTILNWLLGIENKDAALRTGADPSPAQFNILTHGTEDEVLDGTQLAADWTFSGLQKFGQAFLDRLRGRKLPNRLLEKVNLVEIPGILEVRKQVERSFPFNDACQWFIDRADVLFLVYDPAKLDIGPETEAILDQLKGRENQVRIVLNKADTVKPDELLRLQATLIWGLSPLMASVEPPTLYVASLWDRPLNPGSPTSLLVAHENNFLKDIRDATDRRVETRIAAARRFAVRVRNHGKMCDCYLNTYNNHRSFFSNKKKISDDIVEHPQNYHIYEGLSTLTNISRYDLPDPDTYRDFFRLNPLWEFPTLASTCTYFRGCPINKLDIAIAYDLPELLGRYRRQRESILSAQQQSNSKPKPK